MRMLHTMRRRPKDPTSFRIFLFTNNSNEELIRFRFVAQPDCGCSAPADCARAPSANVGRQCVPANESNRYFLRSDTFAGKTSTEVTNSMSAIFRPDWIVLQEEQLTSSGVTSRRA
jgi:hypothetical protein